jgi:hypothetical protein
MRFGAAMSIEKQRSVAGVDGLMPIGNANRTVCRHVDAGHSVRHRNRLRDKHHAAATFG